MRLWQGATGNRPKAGAVGVAFVEKGCVVHANPLTTKIPRPRHWPDVHHLSLPAERNRLVDQSAGADGVDLQALYGVFNQFIRREVLRKLRCIDLARALFVAMIPRLARRGLVGVADLISEQLAVVRVLFTERALNAVQRGSNLKPVANAEADDPGLVKFTQVSK